jgi:flagellar M-ring protein FliF
MIALVEGLKSFGAGRLVALGSVAVVMMSLLTIVALRGQGESMGLLYADLDLRESSQITDVLARQKIQFQLGSGGSQILVSTNQLSQARLLLAKEGLPSGGSIGYEIFDRADTITANQFQQTLNQSRALEGEIARTIRGIKGIKSARVHIVLPKREAFARDRQDAQASIQLTMSQNIRLDNEGTRAIINLVAAAVPGLRQQNIAITDTHGTLLARAGELTSGAATVQNNDETRRAAETRIARAVEEMLERSLGSGHVRIQTTIDLDYEQVKETQERYDPEQQVIRSLQSVTNNSKTTETSGNVSVQNNLPGAEASTPPAGTQDQRQEETTNYEISKTIRTVVRDQPKIARVSVAVMVDGISAKGADGAMIWSERPPEEIERINRLVRSAVGFDEKRGDRVEVVSFQFSPEFEQPNEPPTVTWPFGMKDPDLIRILSTGLFGILSLFGLLFIIRPTVARLTALPLNSNHHNIDTTSIFSTAISVSGDAERNLNIQNNNNRALISAPEKSENVARTAATAPQEDESMVKIANIDGQLKASSIRRIADLVEKHPEESLSIVRGWMQQESI